MKKEIDGIKLKDLPENVVEERPMLDKSLKFLANGNDNGEDSKIDTIKREDDGLKQVLDLFDKYPLDNSGSVDSPQSPLRR